VLFSLFGERERREESCFSSSSSSSASLPHIQTNHTDWVSVNHNFLIFSFWLWAESKAKGNDNNKNNKRFFILNTHVTYFFMLLLFEMEGDYQNSGDQQQ
jgi:putative Ca2+/H+ antiporter (TMEM165/GDT1 family)